MASRLVPVLDRVMDLDSHELSPMNSWPTLFGQAGEDVVALMGAAIEQSMPRSAFFRRGDSTVDDTEINHHNAWVLKGPNAPSALDLTRRSAVLDLMGIDRQLVFPGFALAGLVWDRHPAGPELLGMNLEGSAREDFEQKKKGLGSRVIDAQNRWAIDLVRTLRDSRVRPVGLLPTDSFDALLQTAEYLIDSGIRCIWIPGGTPPAGMSPGDLRMEPLWQLAEDTGTPLVLHVGFEASFLSSTAWSKNVAQFRTNHGANVDEFSSEPLAASTHLAYASEMFLSAMILSGVFERHPGLRFGVIECAGYWVGCLAEKLDLMASQFPTRMGNTLSMQPSEYLARNVRVSTFSFEPVDRYFERFPELSSVYAYSSDFPHVEGGKESKRVVYDKISRLGDDVVESYFVTNGSWLLPD